MHGVNLAEIVTRPERKVVAIQALEVRLGAHLGSQFIECRSDEGRACEERRARFGDINVAQLAGPRIDVLEEMPMDRLQMRAVEVAGDRTFLELPQSSEGGPCFEAL